MRRAARRDENETEIVKALRACGYKVMRLNEFDLLVHGHGDLYMLECKTEDGVLKQSQKDMISLGWPLVIVRSPEEALQAVKPYESPHINDFGYPG